jgi:hypothetical protein
MPLQFTNLSQVEITVATPTGDLVLAPGQSGLSLAYALTAGQHLAQMRGQLVAVQAPNYAEESLLTQPPLALAPVEVASMAEMPVERSADPAESIQADSVASVMEAEATLAASDAVLTGKAARRAAAKDTPPAA